jgi:hypothetical protein
MANQRRAKIGEAWMQLKESKIVSQTITAATSKMREDHLLAADGANFAQWTRELCELGCTYLNASDFFEKPNPNSVLEKIRRSIFLASLHPSLVYDAQGILTCCKMFVFIKKKFKTVSHAAQMNIWQKFMNFRLSNHPSSAGLASKLRNLASKWKTLKVTMDKDTFLGFILQASLDQNTAMSHDFERHVEISVQDHPQNLAPNFDKLVHLLELCQQQDDLAKNKRSLPCATSSGSVMQASVESPELPPFNQLAFLTNIPP